MTRKLILHVGHGKTGSSSIQSVLALNADKLMENGISYPRHKSFATATKGGISSGNGDILFNRNFKVGGTTLLSDEGLCTRLANDTNFKKYILRHNCDIEVILHTRNVIELLASAWGQYIKTGLGFLDFNEYVRTYEIPVYSSVLWWLRASKKYNFLCKVRNYSNYRLSIVDIFFEDLFGGDTEFDLVIPRDRIVNRSLTIAEYNLQRELNQKMPYEWSFISDALIKELPCIKSEKPSISQQGYDAVYERFGITIEQINEQIDPAEKVMIEDRSQYNSLATEQNLSEYFFNQSQVNVLVKALIDRQSRTRTWDGFSLIKTAKVVIKKVLSLLVAEK